MKTLRALTACVALLSLFLIPAVAQADVTLALGGGWEAVVADDALVSILVDQIGENYLAIEIAKDFTQPPDASGAFPGLSITFNQVSPNAVPYIVILDEAVTNLTGTPWTDYHMVVHGGGRAWFDVGLSSGFSMSPFSNVYWSDPGNLFGNPNRATDLSADGGVVLPNASFFPGAGAGELVIGLDLDPVHPNYSFILEEYPTPEPGTLALLLAGLTFVARRRRS